jgi:predicted small secreted protein
MKKSLATTFIALLILTGAATMLSACNTTAGAGKDISAAGQAIHNSAEEHKDY